MRVEVFEFNDYNQKVVVEIDQVCYTLVSFGHLHVKLEQNIWFTEHVKQIKLSCEMETPDTPWNSSGCALPQLSYSESEVLNVHV